MGIIGEPEEIILIPEPAPIEPPAWPVFPEEPGPTESPVPLPTLHDHPFSFLSIVLRGGYWERRLDPRTMETSTRHVRHFNRVRPYDAHSICALDRAPTWTLLFVSRARRTWGFWEGWGTVWRWTKYDAFDSGHVHR